VHRSANAGHVSLDQLKVMTAIERLPPDAISCLGAFQPPVVGARGKVVLAGG
jgi:hypothetical protein